MKPIPLAMAAMMTVVALPVVAATIKTDLCNGFTISRRGNDVIIRCPDQPFDKPWVTWKEAYKYCPNLVITRKGTGNNIEVTFHCDGTTK